MAIQDTDFFLIDDAGTSKKILAGKLKAGLTGTYADMKLLVNKPDYSSRYVKCSDLQSNLPDDHWMMVEIGTARDGFTRGQSVKVSGTKVHSYFPSGPANATGVITDSHSPGTLTENCETELISNVDDTSDAPNIILTFPSDQGFDCFRPGDLVQGSPIYSDSGEGAYHLDENYTRAFNGVLTDWCAPAHGTTGHSVKFTFDPPIDCSSSLRINLFKENDGCKLLVNGNDYASLKPKANPPPTWITIPETTLRTFEFTHVAPVYNIGVAAIECNGVILIDGEPVSIINIDADNNQITVDGGDWTAGADKLVSTAPRLTVASLADPNFVDNESIRMVNAAGDTASYVPVTSTITNVDANEGGYGREFVNSGYIQNSTGYDACSSYTLSVFCTLYNRNESPVIGVNRGDYFSNESNWTFQDEYVQNYNYTHNAIIKKVKFSTAGIPLNEEFHFLVHKNSTTVKAYINGVELPEIENTLSPGSAEDCFLVGGSGISRIGSGGHTTPFQTFKGAMRHLAFVQNQTLDASVFANGVYPKSTASVLAAVGNFGSSGYFYPMDDSVADATIDISPDGRGNATSVVEPLPLVEIGAPLTALTFADPCPDLKFFQPGDLVQDPNTEQIETITLTSDSSAYGVALYWITVDGVFIDDLNATYDNTYSTYGTGWTNNPTKNGSNRIGVVGKTLNITFNPPIPKGHVEFCVSGPSDGRGVLQINGRDCPRWNTNNPEGQTTPDFTFTNDPSVKVISRDPAARTMIVDGGAWAGSDGSGSGDVADRETTVTGPSKSGTAKADGVPASTTFRIKDSNGQWIDNTNRLGESFYVKNASGRVSTARLLEVAIAQASVWQSVTGYVEGSFVEHNGSYWYALSSSYDNSPDDNDPLDWLRLN